MSRALLAIPAACLFVVPAKAQSGRQSAGGPVSTFSSAIDPELVGRWELAEVERLGAIEDFGAAVDEMDCEFGADGQARVMLEVEQDLDTMAREKTFRFATTAGRIIPEEGPMVAYEVVGQDDIRLTTADGLVVRLHRTGE